jgi:tRNA(fMet)-specific endonuclease VapC
MKYILDTNILVAVLNGQKEAVESLDSLGIEHEAVLSVIVFGELCYGALSSARTAENLAKINGLAAVLVLAPVDRAVARRFAEVKALLRRAGIAKSDADLFIAATALELDAVLVTNDRALHDSSIPGLKLENWLSPRA